MMDPVIEGAVDEPQIRTTPRPHCLVCGGQGEILYSGLGDQLFGAWGKWDYRRCADEACGMVWLDPMPLPEDLGKAYSHYYTHASAGRRGGVMREIYRRAKRGYQTERYGYPGGTNPRLERILAKLMYLMPLRRSDVDYETRLLPAVRSGKLLDVGCGSGDWMVGMRELGWQAEGLDFDAKAVEAARQLGLVVHLGALEEQSFEEGCFDAVTLNQVIEHVPDPVATVLECRRILKPGGRLVMFTPNSGSLGHRRFGPHWRGLEPPRHLHIFTMPAMAKLLKTAGFVGISIRPQIAHSVIYESLLLRRGAWADFRGKSRRNRAAWAAASFYNWVEWSLLAIRPSVADCLAGIAIKAG